MIESRIYVSISSNRFVVFSHCGIVASITTNSLWLEWENTKFFLQISYSSYSPRLNHNGPISIIRFIYFRVGSTIKPNVYLGAQLPSKYFKNLLISCNNSYRILSQKFILKSNFTHKRKTIQ